MTTPQDDGPRFRATPFSFLPTNRAGWILVLGAAALVVVFAAAATMLIPAGGDIRPIAIGGAVVVFVVLGLLLFALTRTTWGRGPKDR